ncbi:MAG: hypothetical protein ACR2PA_09660 [Hyphomicrobiaceae bacterium]
MTAAAVSSGRRKAGDEPIPAGLPPALTPWADAFAGMPEAHLLVIGQLIAAISPLIESHENALRSGLAELDAFDDIAAAGPLDRLMTSELMWLKLMRGEFARRVAEGEALRRRPVYRDRADDQAVVVLIDNGPLMLGRRRLIALAALLTLGASALRRGDRFLWAATGHVGPAWQEGLSRRALSRFINQTGADGLDATTVDTLMRTAPIEAADDRAIVWTIAPKHTVFGDWLPRYRFEVDELWPAPSSPGAAHERAYRADVAVISELGVRRSAGFAFPDEQSCADTLRAPFRAKNQFGAHSDSTNWAPAWISREADDGAAILRDANGIALYRRHFAPLRVDFDDDVTLLGARWPGNGPCALVLRQHDEVHAIRFNDTGHIFERGSTTLAADHPLVADDHGPAAMPPLLRLGRKAAFTIAAPNGQLFALSFLSDAVHSALSVALAEQTKDLRLLARSRTWLLCDTERGGQRAFILVHSRTGRRMFLRRDPALAQSRRFAHCEVIGETGGLLAHIDGEWRWIAPAWWNQAEQTTTPPVPGDAILLRVDPIEHTRNAVLTSHSSSQPVGQRRWNAWFWSPGHGLEEWSFAGGTWTQFQRPAPTIDGQVTAMVMIGKDVLARVVDDDDMARLLEFRLGSAAQPKTQDGPRWWENATCVNY